MKVLLPGTLLQLMYLRERLRQVQPGRFIEIGPGSGEVTQLLLDHGWSGCVYDLDGPTISLLRDRFAKEIAEHRFIPILDDYLSPSLPKTENVDLIISCMVMEHLDDESERKFMEYSASCLKVNGRMIGLVPASTRHWGIEDDIAGHCRRYTRNSLLTLIRTTGWNVTHVAGLTYPVSNLLLPLSNFLIRRYEASKLNLSPLERTKYSGRRNVPFKTHFPIIVKLLLNKLTMLPLYQIQKIFSSSDNALVLYFEACHETLLPNDKKFHN